MCNPNVRQLRDKLVADGKISPEESAELRSRVSWLVTFMSIGSLIIGVCIGLIIRM